MTKQRYIIRPCSGLASLGIHRGHVYSCDDLYSKTKVCIGTKENILERYGEENCIELGNTLCPICAEGKRILEKDLKVMVF